MRRLAIILTVFAGILSLGMYRATRVEEGCAPEKNPLNQEGFRVESTRYGARDGSRAVLILPPTGGTNLIDRSYAAQLCAAGFTVFILDNWSNRDEFDLDLRIHERFYERAMRAVETVLVHTKARYVGLLGTSVGAMQATVAASKFPRIRGVFAIVGGTPVPNVTAESEQDLMREVREARFVKFGFHNMAEYAQAIDRVFPLDPGKLPRAFRGKDLGMVISESDTLVPTKYQERLREFWQPKYLHAFSSGHVLTVVRTWLSLRDDVVGFFRKSAEGAPILLNAL